MPLESDPIGALQLTKRSQDIFQMIVDSYLSTGEPIGSRSLSRSLPEPLSPASVRNVMSDLEELGLIYAPHTSAGRMPTDIGLRMFVDGLLQVGDISHEERERIRHEMPRQGESDSLEQILSQASEMLSGLSECAGLVVSEQQIAKIKHIEFVFLEPGQALVILVSSDSLVENRLINIPKSVTPADLVRASNYLKKFLEGYTLDEAIARVEKEANKIRSELDDLSAKVIKSGLAVWSGQEGDNKSLIVRGQANLLNDIDAEDQLNKIRQLFEDLENKKEVIELLGQSERGEGVKIFIGAENELFSLSGSSVIVSPFKNSEHQIVGVMGVIGPMRVNYARIIPMVDYTARLVSRLMP